MSQEYFSPKGKGIARHSGGDSGIWDNEDGGSQSASSSSHPGAPEPPVAPSAPAYMTVGTGSTSQYAAHLQAMLEQDSGYGGSVAGDEASSSSSSTLAAADHRSQAAAVHQLWYNQHRATLGRAISTVVELLRELQEKNAVWPAHYPSVQRAALDAPSRPDSRPGIQQAYSTAGDLATAQSVAAPAPPLRRAMTSIEDAAAESSRAAERRAPAEPRLVTPQIAQEFSVLKLDLKLGALHQAELVHSLEKGSIASLLDGKIQSSIKHLQSLRERIEDTSSKVLVTGDLNAGKSTFCNALLRRKILPEDQQPCTSIFCEVLDARENCGIEEVHAVHKDAIYDRHDETTYDVYSLRDLEKIVVDNTLYLQCKVYVKDVRTIDESLLNNGVVDIALIDAPGLNMDTTKTTAIFARQEEIDVVVFVVSASNHFTQTSTEFIRAAAAEKAYLFIVVNGYDSIRDKDRCKKLILNQISALSPATYKESAELVHFVSSAAIPMAPAPPGGPGGGGSGSASGGGFDDDPGDGDPKGKGKQKEMMRDFSALEQSLRRFVLEKRARSKLAPAKTYLMNILNDVNVLATVNVEVAQSEFDRVSKELAEIEPQLESSKRARTETSDKIDQAIEDTCKDVYDYSRATISSAIARAGDGNLGIPYPGLFRAFQYADELKDAMLSRIAASVVQCEEHARSKTVAGVNMIKQLGILHLGNEYENLNFKSDVMFQHKKHALARQVDIATEFWDFVDWSTLLQREEKAGMALTVAGVVGTGVISGYGQVNIALRAAQLLGSDNLRRLIVPGVIAAAAAMAFYILSQIPHSLPHRLNAKIATQLAAMDYVHTNSTRISGTVRKVLLIPANSLRVGLQRSVEQLDTRRNETLKVRNESHDALRFFGNLAQRSAHQRRQIEAVDLDAHPPGAHGGH
ncbi:c8ae7f7d-243c-490c-9796-83101e73a1f1 [Thermothielavioides terrestris]|uniref:C8ae7f7d-243c-490c-9796-83101e73a1f1 n=1 Tax=Thermothielavioides terrestris TaxID=2587410 RepID=A0A446BKG6_9PEZI|nr:c8ae7f7d-243c-490c-9796-83101e73a1f1 [Thermothielavioides terrestris]